MRTTFFADMASTTSGNALVIGMVTYARSKKLRTDTQNRDQARILQLRKEFDTVFSINSPEDRSQGDPNFHVGAKMSSKGAESLIELMGTPQHKEKKINVIMLDYVRFPGGYYHKFLTGESTAAVAAPMIGFIHKLLLHNALADGCKIFFTCSPSSDRWSKTVENMSFYFGTPEYVVHEENPLFRAGEEAKEALLMMSTSTAYDQRDQIAEHTTSAKPFCVFTLSKATAAAPKAASVCVTPKPLTEDMWRKQSRVKVKSSFTTDKQVSISIRPKHAGMQMVFPGKLNSEGKNRIALTLAQVEPFGISPAFAEFIKKLLEPVVKKWRTLAAGKKWVKDKRQAFKIKVQDMWRQATRIHSAVRNERRTMGSAVEALGHRMSKRKAESNNRPVKRRLPLASPVYKPKKASTHSIPIPVFDELVDGHVVDLSISLHVYPRHINGRKDFGIICVPKSLVKQGVRAEYSLGVEFGVDPEWLAFVADNLRYAVGTWTTLKKARRWCLQLAQTRDFVDYCTEVWREKARWAGVGGPPDPSTRFWTVGKSNAPKDKKYIKAFEMGHSWGFDPKEGPGSGLFATKYGRFTIYFHGPHKIVEKVKPPIRRSQARYIAGIPKSDKHLAPTMSALKIGVIPHAFIVNHNRKEPTHEASYDCLVDAPCLLPLRDVVVGEEFFFDYGWDKGVDIPSQSDDPDSEVDEPVDDKKPVNKKLNV